METVALLAGLAGLFGPVGLAGPAWPAGLAGQAGLAGRNVGFPKGSQAVSLAITRASHSRLQGFTRPTKLRFPEIAISGKIAIFDFPDFFVKNQEKSGKVVF